MEKQTDRTYKPEELELGKTYVFKIHEGSYASKSTQFKLIKLDSYNAYIRFGDNSEGRMDFGSNWDIYELEISSLYKELE
jgi:hypothetical protein